MEKIVLLPAVLTASEKRVLGLMRRGLTNAEISQELGRSLSTIKTHVEHILAKTGARNRTHACAFNANVVDARVEKNRPSDR